MKWLEQIGLIVDHLDTQAFSAPLPYQDRFEFAALYTLQHRLSRDPEFHCSFQHRQIVRWGLLQDPRPQLIGDANLPWGAGSDLLACDEAISQPTVNGRSVEAEDLRSFANRRQFSLRWLSRWLEAGNLTITAQTTDLVGRKALAGGGFASLAIEDAGDYFIRMS